MNDDDIDFSEISVKASQLYDTVSEQINDILTEMLSIKGTLAGITLDTSNKDVSIIYYNDKPIWQVEVKYDDTSVWVESRKLNKFSA